VRIRKHDSDTCMFRYVASQPKPRRRESHQLPPGRHGLSRTFVEANQRQRILDAVAEVVSLVGYQAMRVDDVIAVAGVSRRTFYDHFRSKDDAFLTAFDSISAKLVEHVQAAYSTSPSFDAGVIAGLRAFLEFVASEPQYADMCIVEALAAGPAAIERRNAVKRTFADLIGTGAEAGASGIQSPALTAETIVGGLYEVVHSHVAQGKTRELPELLPDLAYSMMLPYLGREAAARKVEPLRAKTDE
jgi:AcrR family transcriptional regulator